MRRALLALSFVVACGAERSPPPVVQAHAGPSDPLPVPVLRPPAPPTPGHVAIDRRGLPCLIRGDGTLACDRFGHPAELIVVDEPALAVQRAEEWICARLKSDIRCWRGTEQATFSSEAVLATGGGLVCAYLGDRLTCLGPGTDRPGERFEHRFEEPLAVRAAAVDDGVACHLTERQELGCLSFDADEPRFEQKSDLPLQTLDVGGGHLCALDVDGTVACRTLDGRIPLQPVPGAPAATAVAVGIHHTCVLSSLGRVACWRHPELVEGSESEPRFSAPYIVDLPLHDVVAIDAAGPFTVSLDARRGLHRWRIEPPREPKRLLELQPMPLMGLDSPAPPDSPECTGCRRVAQLGEERCVKEPRDGGSGVTQYTTCAMRCCWVPPGWSR